MTEPKPYDWWAENDPDGTLTAPPAPRAPYRFADRGRAVNDINYWHFVRPAAARRSQLLAAVADFVWRSFGARIAEAPAGQAVLERIARRIEASTPPPGPQPAHSPVTRTGPPVTSSHPSNAGRPGRESISA